MILQLPSEIIMLIFDELPTYDVYTMSVLNKFVHRVVKKILLKRRKYEENHLMRLLKTFSDKNWNWFWVSENPNITWDYVQKHPNIPWNYSGLSRNKNITWDIVQNNPDKQWNYYWLSTNLTITWNIINKYDNIDDIWDYYALSLNPNITCEQMLETNNTIGWTWGYNKNVTYDFVVNHPELNWCFHMLAENTFNKSR